MENKKILGILMFLTAFSLVAVAQADTALTFHNAQIDMNGNNITNLPTSGIKTSGHAISKGFADTEYVNRDGDSMTGQLDMVGENITNIDFLIGNNDPITVGNEFDMNNNRIRNLQDGTSSQDAVALGQADNRYVQRTGDTMTGALDMSSNQINNLGSATSSSDAVTLGQADSRYLNRDGTDSMGGNLDMNGNNITNVDAIQGDSPVNLLDQIDMNSNQIKNIADATSSQDAVALGQADNRYVTRSGDSITGDMSHNSNDINDVGTLNANTKNFVQDINSTHEAVYTAQESRSARAVVEGSTYVDSETFVELPEDFNAVASDTSPRVYVQVTPHSLENVAVTSRNTQGFTVKSTGETTVDYRVTAVRDGYESKTVVRPQ